MPALFSGSVMGGIFASNIEPAFRSFVQLCMAQLNIFGFVPVFNNVEATGDDGDGIFETQFRSQMCDQLSMKPHLADSALAALTSAVGWILVPPVMHLILNTVSTVAVALCKHVRRASCAPSLPPPQFVWSTEAIDKRVKQDRSTSGPSQHQSSLLQRAISDRIKPRWWWITILSACMVRICIIPISAAKWLVQTFLLWVMLELNVTFCLLGSCLTLTRPSDGHELEKTIGAFFSHL